MWQDTSKRDGCADKCIEFFVTANGELEVAGCDSLDFEVLGGVLQKLAWKYQADTRYDSRLRARELQQ